MWVFKSKIRNSYLATNPKVMGSTLLQQPNLTRFVSKERYAHFLVKEVSKSLGPEYIMLVRNPYFRVESYFREKLRQKVRKVFDKANPYILKRHQEIFYPYLGVKASDSTELKVQRLLNFSFKDFVSKIPEVWAIEDHLTPQTHNFTRTFLGFERTMKMNRYIHVEKKEELEWLATYLGLDLAIHANSSSSEGSEEIDWDIESIDIIKNVYKRDFEILGYDVNHPIFA